MMASPSTRTFYRTTYTVEVLSEEPIPDELTFPQVLGEADEGGYSSQVTAVGMTALDGPGAARALRAQGSDPEFFGLTEDGDDLEDEEPGGQEHHQA